MTKTLRVRGSTFRPLPVVTLNGQTIEFEKVAMTPFPFDGFVDYAGEVSEFAGLNGVALKIKSPPIGIDAFAFIDDIRFSPAPIPEPRSLALLISVPTLWLRRGERNRDVYGLPEALLDPAQIVDDAAAPAG